MAQFKKVKLWLSLLMDNFVAGNVYDNLIKAMTYRGATLKNPPLSRDMLAQQLNHHEYVIIEASREMVNIRGPATIMVFMFAPGAKYADTLGTFRKLIGGITAHGMLELMFVSEDPLTNHIKKFLAQYRVDNITNRRVEEHDYRKFRIEAPKHTYVPEHILMTEQEIGGLCEMYRISRGDLPHILASDIQAVWLGLRPGMCVKIVRPSDSAGQCVAYRVCVAG